MMDTRVNGLWLRLAETGGPPKQVRSGENVLFGRIISEDNGEPCHSRSIRAGRPQRACAELYAFMKKLSSVLSKLNEVHLTTEITCT